MTSLNRYYETCHYLPQVGTLGLRAELTVSPFAWQSKKALLFYFPPNSVSEIWFDTGKQWNWSFGIITQAVGRGTGIGWVFRPKPSTSNLSFCLPTPSLGVWGPSHTGLPPISGMPRSHRSSPISALCKPAWVRALPGPFDHGLIQDWVLFLAHPGSCAWPWFVGMGEYSNVIDSAGQHWEPVPRKTEGCGQMSTTKRPGISASRACAAVPSPWRHAQQFSYPREASMLGKSALTLSSRDVAGVLLAAPCHGEKASVTMWCRHDTGSCHRSLRTVSFDIEPETHWEYGSPALHQSWEAACTASSREGSLQGPGGLMECRHTVTAQAWICSTEVVSVTYGCSRDQATHLRISFQIHGCWQMALGDGDLVWKSSKSSRTTAISPRPPTVPGLSAPVKKWSWAQSTAWNTQGPSEVDLWSGFQWG